MTRILLVVRHLITRKLLAEELRSVFAQCRPLCCVDEAEGAKDAFERFLKPATDDGWSYNCLIIDSLLHNNDSFIETVAHYYSTSSSTLTIHLATMADLRTVAQKYNSHQTRQRRLSSGQYNSRNCYEAVDRTLVFNGDLMTMIVSQSIDCYLDGRRAAFCKGEITRPKGPRRKHTLCQLYTQSELFRVIESTFSHCDEAVRRRLKHDFGLDEPLISVRHQQFRRMPFQDTNFYESLAKHVLLRKEDDGCSPFMIHYLLAERANEGQSRALEHGVTDARLIVGYKRGFRAAADAFLQSSVPRSDPLSRIKVDACFEDSGTRRVHAIVCNLDRSDYDAGCINDEDKMPYILLPHRWQCADRDEVVARGFSFAAHEATHVFNQSILIELHRLRQDDALASWEWFDEATAIYMEAALFEHEFPSGPQLWTEHLEDWIFHPFCPVVDRKGPVPYCGRGAHAAMFLRYITRRLGVDFTFLNRIWNTAATRLLRKEPIAPALVILEEEIIRCNAAFTLRDVFEEYASNSYAVRLLEPKVSARFGDWRSAETITELHETQTFEFSVVEPRPFACAYHLFAPSEGVRSIRVQWSDSSMPTGVGIQLAWVDNSGNHYHGVRDEQSEGFCSRKAKRKNEEHGVFVLILTQTVDISRSRSGMIFVIEAE